MDFDKWISVLISALSPMQGQVNWFAHYNPTKNEDALGRYTKQVYQDYGTLDGQLQKSGGKSVLPAGFSAVDAPYYPSVAEAEFGGLSLDGYPYLMKWYEAISERKDTKAAEERIAKAEPA